MGEQLQRPLSVVRYDDLGEASWKVWRRTSSDLLQVLFRGCDQSHLRREASSSDGGTIRT